MSTVIVWQSCPTAFCEAWDFLGLSLRQAQTPAHEAQVGNEDRLLRGSEQEPGIRRLQELLGALTGSHGGDGPAEDVAILG